MESSHPKISNIHNGFNPNSSPYLKEIKPNISILSQRNQTQSIHPISNKFNPNSLPYLKPGTDFSQTPHPTYDTPPCIQPMTDSTQTIHSISNRFIQPTFPTISPTHAAYPISKLIILNPNSQPYLQHVTDSTQTPIFFFNL